jgi:hypothetical protein
VNEFDLRDLPPERRLSVARRREMKERLMQQIELEERTARGRYRLVVGAVAATLLVVAGAIAAYAGWSEDEPTEVGPAGQSDPADDDHAEEVPDQPGQESRTVPDPEEAAQATENLARFGPGAFEVGPDVDRVECVAPGTQRVTRESSGSGQVRDVPLDQVLTADMYVAACATGDWPWYEQESPGTAFDPARASMCVRPGDYGPPENRRNDDFPLAVVALDGLTCEEIGEGVTVRPVTDEDLATLNRMRAIEVAVHANPDSCPSVEEAQRWAEDRFAEEGIEVEAVAPEVEQGEGLLECFQPGIEWQFHDYDEDAGAPTNFGLNVSVNPIPDL